MPVFPRWTLLVVALLVSVAGPGPLRGQDVQAFVVSGRSDHRAFPSTSGAGIGTAFQVHPRIRAEVQLDRLVSRLDRVGRACVRPTLGHQCGVEAIRTRNTFASFSAAALATMQPRAFVRLGVGFGVVMGTTDSSNEAASGRQADVFVQRTAHAGVLARLSVRIQPAPGVPLHLLGQWELRRVSLGTCSGGPDSYAPFCGVVGSAELRVGAGVGW